MKPKKLKLIATVLMLAGSFSCQTMSTSEEVIEPVLSDDDVIAFFKEYLPVYSFPLSECFFFDKEDKEDKYVMINSMNEFRKSFSCPSAILPAIDFTLNTLIIGQHRVSCICDYVVEQEIVIKPEEVVLNLRWSCPDGAYASFGTLSYWGIYPKIQVKTISVNIEGQ